MSSQAIHPIKYSNRYPVAQKAFRGRTSSNIQSPCSLYLFIFTWNRSTIEEDYSQLVMSRIMRSDLLCLLGNKRLKVTDKQCGQSVCQRLLKRCVFTVCICAFPHIPQKECDFFLWPRACKRLFVSVWQKQFASWILWTAETMFLLIREWQRKKEREKKTGSPTDETETNLL